MRIDLFSRYGRTRAVDDGSLNVERDPSHGLFVRSEIDADIVFGYFWDNRKLSHEAVYLRQSKTYFYVNFIYDRLLRVRENERKSISLFIFAFSF